MFKFLRKRGNFDNDTDPIADSNINISDSQPILNNRRYDLSNNVHHDLTRNEEPGKWFAVNILEEYIQRLYFRSKCSERNIEDDTWCILSRCAVHV